MIGYDEWMRRLCLHEAGHQCVADAFGWKLGGVTVRGGSSSDGCSIIFPPMAPVPDFDHTLPFTMWPLDVQGNVMQRTVIALAGDLAMIMFGAVPAGRSESAVSERAADLAGSGPEPSGDVLARLREVVSAEGEIADDDASRVAKMARIAHVGDLPGAQAFIEYATTQATQAVARQADRIGKLADWLLLTDTLSGPQVAAMLRE
jgi:hypothetical protein